MEKYSKSKLKRKQLMPVLIIILGIILVMAGTFIIYLTVKNNIVIENVDESAKFVSDDIAASTTPIVVNNAIIGGVYNKTWVSSDKYYMKSTNKGSIDVDVYTKIGKAGKYKLGEFSKQADSLAIFTTTTWINKADEYFAVAATETSISSNVTKQVITHDTDVSKAKETLGLFRLFNFSLKITQVYDIRINEEESGKIICVTSDSNSFFGVYSAIIYVSNTGKSSVIKYNYVKNVKKASDWPIYSLVFVADLNQDSKNELITQETSEFNVKYDVIEFRDKKFYEVLSTKVKL